MEQQKSLLDMCSAALMWHCWIVGSPIPERLGLALETTGNVARFWDGEAAAAVVEAAAAAVAAVLIFSKTMHPNGSW